MACAFSSSNARITEAKCNWQDGRLPKVPGDKAEFILLPAEHTWRALGGDCHASAAGPMARP
jgi:hypothetical protein